MKVGKQIGNDGERGSVLLIALIAIVVLCATAFSMLAAGVSAQREVHGSLERTHAMYQAEAGIHTAVAALRAGLPAEIGTSADPERYGNGTHWGTVVDNGDDTLTITSIGSRDGATRAIEATILRVSGGVFQNAVFAGNSGGDAAYVLSFGGLGVQADAIDGNVYCGQNVRFDGDATIDGVPSAGGTVSVLPGSILGSPPPAPEEGISQPNPDIAGMHYEVNNDVDVAAEFTAATFGSAPGGGDAWQLPEANPAHIFRLNPDDRTSNWSATAKNDYFLEDPYQAMHGDAGSTGADCYKVKLTDENDTNLTSPVDGNRKLYFIDGNLWVHNRHTMSLMLEHGSPNGVQVTFVVKGNIYISDNIFYADKDQDGLALIAIKDAAESDSGNIYFGDPTFGTLEHMSSFMYAENNFYDNNLSATGSATVSLNGTMSAGNQVAINRDFGAQHSKLGVGYDGRIADGTLEMPGLPNFSGQQPTFSIVMWREVAVP